MMIYYAAPWFSAEQAAIHERVYEVLRTSRHQVFSPKHQLEVKPNDDRETRRRAFVQNLAAIWKSDFVLAVTDYKDVGTIFEAGFAYRSNKPIIYYAETLGDRPFNLMLAESAVSVVRSCNELANLLDRIESPTALKSLSFEYQGVIE